MSLQYHITSCLKQLETSLSLTSSVVTRPSTHARCFSSCRVSSLCQIPRHRSLHTRSRVSSGNSASINRSKGLSISSRKPFTTVSSSAMEPTIHSEFEPDTGTWQYIVADSSTMTAAIIDPVLDFDRTSQSLTTHTADALLALVKEKGYKVDWVLETHVHADHLTAASYLQKRLAEQQGYKPSIAIGKRIGQVQRFFGKRYGVPEEQYEVVFDHLLEDDEQFVIGSIQATAMHLPGHTPDHMGYKVGDNVFCGDSVFHADIGSARCDFPGGSSESLYSSGRKLLSLPDNVKIWTGHDYPPKDGRSPQAYMTVHDHREQNKHLKDGITAEEFVAMRNERDAGLSAPRMLHQSLQINIRGGRLPSPTPDGHRMLRLPLDIKAAEW
ncbi:metallo-beta-lactamase superfamily protein [Trichoderma gamsii]|uniref:Metallo-beta-lactamase superfamily protein n=1 Tax=Trichoderma gamsii TaxID=398673 RepID=A0A2P4ZEB4_9HYPO|nr:metallo-beta-lactamase superfamily protein [Trichoderma gamsii]PON22611.1 metallo-beta-lactamase superfamily protein [Trichoderma gamsii]